MQDFLIAASPWIAMGLAVAIALAYFNSKAENNKKDSKK